MDDVKTMSNESLIQHYAALRLDLDRFAEFKVAEEAVLSRMRPDPAPAVKVKTAGEVAAESAIEDRREAVQLNFANPSYSCIALRGHANTVAEMRRWFSAWIDAQRAEAVEEYKATIRDGRTVEPSVGQRIAEEWRSYWAYLIGAVPMSNLSNRIDAAVTLARAGS